VPPLDATRSRITGIHDALHGRDTPLSGGSVRGSLGVVDVSPLLRELLLEQLRAVSEGERASSIPRCTRDEPGADLESICRQVGASRRTTERRFREETTASLGQWRQRPQLIRAIELMAEGRSVTGAAATVGYSTTSAFITAFRRQLGTTPGRYFDRSVTSGSEAT
jgi:AraC-like DNA-binding protein